MTTTTRHAATLWELLDADGLDLAPRPLEWMVLTWDLAKIGGNWNRFFRLFLTVDGGLTCHSNRSADYFSTVSPKLGDVEELSGAEDHPMDHVTSATEAMLEEGYHWLCRPLAVDCSVYADQVERPHELLVAMMRSTSPPPRSSLGSEVLRTVNATRDGHVGTHLDVDWHQHFPRTPVRLLWAGM